MFIFYGNSLQKWKLTKCWSKFLQIFFCYDLIEAKFYIVKKIKTIIMITWQSLLTSDGDPEPVIPQTSPHRWTVSETVGQCSGVDGGQDRTGQDRTL